MNSKPLNQDVIRKLFSNQGSDPDGILLEAIFNFFKKMPDDYVSHNLKNTEFICINNNSCIKYNILEDNQKSILINFGHLDDLDISSITGLVAHLFALINIDYHKKVDLEPEEWLDIDLYSDDIAREWGFKKEVDDLRKIRSQKIPNQIKYPEIMINTSVPNKQFESDIFSLLDNDSSPSNEINNKIWYVDRFSVLCDLQDLRENKIENIHILTNKYKINDLEQALNYKLLK